MSIKLIQARLAVVTAAPVLEDTPQNRQMVITKFAKKFMPAGTKFSHHGAEWLKKGGHAGSNAMVACEKRAEALGFVHQDDSNDSNADGSSTSSASVFKHPAGWMLRTNASYGSTASSNYFHCNLTPPK